MLPERALEKAKLCVASWKILPEYDLCALNDAEFDVILDNTRQELAFYLSGYIEVCAGKRVQFRDEDSVRVIGTCVWIASPEGHPNTMQHLVEYVKGGKLMHKYFKSKELKSVVEK